MRRAILLLATLPLGCPGTYHLHFDGQFSEQTKAATVAAVKDWERHVPVTIRIEPGPCPAWRGIEDICLHPVDYIEPQSGEPGYLVGLTLGTEIYLVEFVVSRYAFADAQWVLAHELGHAQGLVHTGPGTLMYPYPDKTSKIVTASDVQQWIKVHIWPIPLP